MSVSTIAKRFKRSVLIVVAAAVAIVTGPLAPANAAGNIPVGYDAVEPKTDTVLPTSPCTSLPTTGGEIVQLSDSQLPGSYGNCSYISAHYIRGGVDLPLSSIYVDGSDVVLVPQVSAAMQSNQNKVRLSIPLKSLDQFDGTNNSPIRLHYADATSFKRIALSLSPNAKGTDGNAQPDINMDGTQLTGARHLFLYKDQNGKYIRTVTVDVPRMQDIVWNQTGGNGTVSFNQTNDLSSTERTVRTYDITYVPKSNTDVSEASAVVYGDTYKRTWVTAHADSTSKEDTAEMGLEGVGDYEPTYDCGYGYCSARFPDKVQEPFFYKVTSTTAGDMDSPIYQRTGIPARAINYATTDEDTKKFFDDTGISNTNWPNRLLDPTIKVPSPLSSTNNGYDKTTIGKIGDVQHTADSDWPLFNQFTDQGLYQGSELQQVNDGSNSYGQQIGYSNSGKDQSMAFYVQYNGLRAKATQTNHDTWSYFLNKLDLNGQFFDIPYPKIPEKGLNVVPQGKDLFTDDNGKPTVSGQSDDNGKAYFNAREAMLGSDFNEHSLLSPDSLPDDQTDATPPSYYLACPIGGNGSGRVSVGQNAYGDTFKPATLYEKTIDKGVNAGITVKVELINARTQGDVLGDGFTRWNIAGKKAISKLQRHHFAPSYGAPTQMINLTPCYKAGSRHVYTTDPSPNRTVAEWNQWKTLYRVTVTGMVNKKLNVNLHYGYTSQPTIWKGASYPAQNFWIKDQGNWVDFTNSNGSIALNHFWEDPNEGNVKFKLKDGFINPELTTYSGRTSRAVCGTPENTKCTPMNSGNVNSDGTFSYNVQLTSSQTQKITAPDRNSYATVMTSTAQPVSLNAQLVSTPLLVMSDTAGTLPASQENVPEQYDDHGKLTGVPVDGQSNYYLKVNGDIPQPQKGQSFTGYELYGVLNDGKHTRVPLMEGHRLYPGDAVSTADAGVKLSNDTFTAARYESLQLVPTFDATSLGVPRLYSAAKFLKKSGNLTWQGNDFNFFAAPGLTATVNNYSPADKLTVDGKDYPYSAADSTLSAVVPAPSGDDSPAQDDDILKFVYLAPADAQVKVNLQHTWLDLDNVDWSGTPQKYPSSMQGSLHKNEESIPVTVTVTRTRTSDGKADGKAVTFTTNPSSSQAAFATAVAGFTSGDKVSLSYSYEVKNRLMCIVQQGDISKNAGSVNDVTVPATPASRLYATNADGKPQEFTSTLFDNLNEFTLNIDAGCHQGVIVYPQGNIPDKYTYTDSQGKHLLPRDTPEHQNLWTNEYPMQNSDGSYRYDGTYPDGQPTAWDWFHRKVQYPTLVTPYENLEPDPNGAGEYDSSKSMEYAITSLDDSAESVRLGVRKYAEVPAGRWAFGHSNRPLWKHEINCPGVKTVYNSSGVAIGATVVPGKATVCFLEAKTSEITILGDMPQYLRDSWIFTLQSDDGSGQHLISGEKVTGKVVTGSDNIHKCFDTCQYYPGKLQVAATNVKKIASSTPKFYMYNQNDESHNATTADQNIHDDGYWDELVKGEEVETWPAYRRWAADIHADVLYKVTGDHRVEEEPTGEPKAVEVAGSQHIALKVVITPITNSTLPSAGGMGTTWKIVGIITLIAALFLAIVALLKKRAMQ